MASVGGTESGEPEFQIAPMIDVLLVLLIFFMSITTAEVLKIDKGITLPVSKWAKKRPADMAKHECALNVRWEDKKSVVKVDDKEYPVLDELIPILKAKLKHDDKLRIIVRADRELPAIEIQRIMTTVAQGGIMDISFAASNKE